MTVTARPLPPRIAGNSIRPFRPALPTNNIRPFVPRVPAPLVRGFLRPNPWVLGVGAVVIAALVLWQLWGYLAGPARSRTPSYNDPTVTTFEYATTGSLQIYWQRYLNGRWRLCNSQTWNYNGPSTVSGSYPGQNNTNAFRIISNGVEFATGCLTETWTPPDFGLRVQFRTNGVWGEILQIAGNLPAFTSGRVHEYTYSWPITEVKINGATATPIGTAAPWESGVVITPTPLPQAPQSTTRMPAAPLLPQRAADSQPVGQPATTAIQRVPARLPGVPQLLREVAKLPQLIGLPNGFVEPALPEKITTTAPDLHYPVPGGRPVNGLAEAPPATLEGIAREVGRIEAKLNRLLNPIAPGDSTDLLQLLWQAIQALYNSMIDNRPAGAYLLSTPCELDEDGDRIVSSVGYPETSDNTAAVLARIDALAALLQTHKDLKQPICRQTPAVGQPVQVQFVQIE